MTAMNDVTRLLSQMQQGNRLASESLLPLVYDELRKLARQRLAREKPGQTLQATALVHEAYLRLVGPNPDQHWENRGHFFAAAAEAMRRILVEKARRKQSRKGGGDIPREEVHRDEIPVGVAMDPLEVLAIHEALERLAQRSPRKAELVKLRYFLGCTIPEAAEILEIAPATAEEDWTYAKAWLRRELGRGDEKRPAP
jgi:RNA polymerase sigma factor (TIGR02999 family)